MSEIELPRKYFIMATNICNCDCDYCYSPNEPRVMPERVLKKSIQEISTNVEYY